MTEIEKKINDLRETLRYHSDRYYNDEIEDYEYDMMMRELKSLEEEYPEYDAVDSPTKRLEVRQTIPLKVLRILSEWRVSRTHSAVMK